MPSRCTKCGKLHPDTADYLLAKGCECGGRFFFFVRQEQLEEMNRDVAQIPKVEMEEIERDIREILPSEGKKGETVVLDLEAVRVIKPGKYHIDVTSLFSQKPIIIRTGAGKYEIDISTLAEKMRNRKGFDRE